VILLGSLGLAEVFTTGFQGFQIFLSQVFWKPGYLYWENKLPSFLKYWLNNSESHLQKLPY